MIPYLQGPSKIMPVLYGWHDCKICGSDRRAALYIDKRLKRCLFCLPTSMITTQDRDRYIGWTARIIRYGSGDRDETRLEMAHRQKGRCGICRKHESQFRRKFAMDHDHYNGMLRGLLCNGCNPTLGFLDKPDLIDAAKNYLETSRFWFDKAATQIAQDEASG